ncbi:MAG TPA: glycosyltransferase family 9 protein, partial [Candidatus Kapabacteria bacterium]|nr:glycosyltransferase family 9 protein [Candidatus Kapabacteria bacterium]
MITEPKKILVILWGALGDIIVVTPALRAVREKYPAAHITLVTNPMMYQIAPEKIFADTIIALEPTDLKSILFTLRLGLRLSREKFDLAINFRYTSERSALLTWLSRAHVRAGAGPTSSMWCYTEKLHYPPSHYHQLYRYADMVTALGIIPRNLHPYVFCSDEHRAFAKQWFAENHLSAPVVAMQPGASNAYRAWLPERYAEIGKRIVRDFGIKILITHAPHEKAAAEFVAEQVGSSAVLAPATPTIGHLAALFEQCSMVICNNSGAMHVAVAIDTPVVALHGS